MEFTSFVGPWVSLLLVLLPVIAAERWIHQHAYGVGYLLTNDEGSATTFYYVIFFPGVFLHEFIQWLVAGVLDVKIKKLEVRPQKQSNGTMRFDFVTIDRKKTDIVRASIVGGVPFLGAALLFYFISTSVLDMHGFLEALGTSDIPTIGAALRDLVNTPDFWLWMYFLFAISNGMIPTKEDREGWWLILGAVGIFTGTLLFLGLDQVVIETLDGPVREGLELVTTSLMVILVVDIMVILLLGIAEDTLERVRGFKMDYSSGTKKSRKAQKREPGSNLPLPKGEPMPSVYNIELPIPSLPTRK